jgi:flavin reductase (DIM6/NTAB) family NADH-FMN oxidoreductase RutF
MAERDPFDDLMAGLDPSMVIVTTVAGDQRSGCLVGFHSQCSIDPPRYLVWISTANHTHGVAEAATIFAVHLVPADRHDLAELFGGRSGDDVDKLARCDWTPGIDGVPLLDACPDRFVGRRVGWLDEGTDHSGIILEPLDAAASGRGPWLRLRDVADVDAGHAADE